MNKKSKISKIVMILSILSIIFACSTNTKKYDKGNYKEQKAPDIYTIKKGDTLFSISWRYGLEQEKIMSLNNIKNPNRIFEGQRLVLTKKNNSHTRKNSTSYKNSKKNTENKSSYKKVSSVNWIWPIKGEVIRGFNSNKIGGNGIRIKGYKDQTVNAVESGEVVYQGTGLNGYGNVIIIRHKNNLLTAYGFLETTFVKKGDKVKKRQRIAKVGRVNKNTYALHFEVRKNGKPENPRNYIGYSYNF